MAKMCMYFYNPMRWGSTVELFHRRHYALQWNMKIVRIVAQRKVAAAAAVAAAAESEKAGSLEAEKTEEGSGIRNRKGRLGKLDK
jgi:hypothetical protein